MPGNYKLSPLAEKDMENIFDYTIDSRGKTQADKYTRQLYDRFQWLADRPQIGTQRNNVREGYLSFSGEEHTIYYRIADSNTIEIIGIPHQRMDIERHLFRENIPDQEIEQDDDMGR